MRNNYGSRTTKENCNIEERIEAGRTLVFDNELTARDEAKQMNSYYYPVFMNGKSTGEYAVPR